MNSTRVNRYVVRMVLAALFAGLLSAGGCGGKDDEPKHVTAKGKVVSVDPASGEVKMSWYNPKQKTEQIIPGTLAPNAEILINGKTARLEDVQIDDEVTVTGRREKRDGQVNLIADRVDIRRLTTEPASAPATEPK